MDLPVSVARLIGGCALEYDSQGRSGARVYRCGDAFLKIDRAGSLRRAAIMQEYFCRKGLAGALRAYESEGERDFLLVEAAPGVSACGSMWLGAPERLCARLGQAVRALHETPAFDCPLRDVNERARADYERRRGRPAPSDSSLRVDTLVHGDCCLPNVFLTDTAARFIDLGDSGLGDAHFDLYWALWSLQYNLKTDRYGERFLDAYGRDRVDRERLCLCARLSEGD